MKHQQAFPDHAGNPGMTLRDWFAGQALSAMNCLSLDQTGTRYGGAFMAQAAANAYRYADAMLEKREES